MCHPPLRLFRAFCSLWICFAGLTCLLPAEAWGSDAPATAAGSGIKPKKTISVLRKDFRKDRTLGYVAVDGKIIACSLELPWVDNEQYFSAIPAGTYNAYVRENAAGKLKIQLTGVNGRDTVQIHIANSPTELLGCIAVGQKVGSDGNLIGSGPAFTKLASGLKANDPVVVKVQGAFPSVPGKTELLTVIKPTSASPGTRVTITANLRVIIPGSNVRIPVTGKAIRAYTDAGKRVNNPGDLSPIGYGVEQPDGSVQFLEVMPPLRNSKIAEQHNFFVFFDGDNNYKPAKQNKKLMVSLNTKKAGKE